MKILQIGSYPPPNTGWTVRIKFLKEGFINQGDTCKVLNIGRNRKIKSDDYVGVKNGIDYFLKLIHFRLKGYHFHIHMNGQAVKGPILSLTAQIVSLLMGERAATTFHGGAEQLYFPKKKAGKMFLPIYLNFLISKLIICNNDPIKQNIANYGPFIFPDKIVPIPAFSSQYLQYKTVKLPDRIEQFMAQKRYVALCYIVLRHGFLIKDTVAFFKKCSNDIGFILSGISAPEDKEVEPYLDELLKLQTDGKVIIADNFDHDTFMTLLEKCLFYLRTHISDGVSSSVLEALAQGIPVVACDNGQRPDGVITFKVNDVEDMSEKLDYVIGHHEQIKKSIKKPAVRDTLQDELSVLKTKFI